MCEANTTGGRGRHAGGTGTNDGPEMARPDAYVRMDEAAAPQRSQFRPFIAASRHEQRDLDKPLSGWSVDKDLSIEALKMDAQRMADRIERLRILNRGDARSNGEFDLARRHLEDCVMRATRGLSS